MLVEGAAYGFRIVGLEAPGALAVSGARSWPVLQIRRSAAPKWGPPGAMVTERWASIQTPSGRLEVERSLARVTVHACESVPDTDLVHPGLWPAAAVFARWRGAETLHAGAFIDHAGSAWVVLGERGAGKSTLLARLALAGYRVLADDLVVVAGRECFAGPRCLDLRPPAATALDIERRTSPVRSTQRRRLALGPIAGRAALRGFVHLAWGESLRVEHMYPAELLGLLVSHRRVSMLGIEIDTFLDLAGLPAVRLTRPQRWDGLGTAVEALRSVGASTCSDEFPTLE